MNIPFIVFFPAGVFAEGAFGSDVLQMIMHAGVVVKFVLMILFLFSILSWTIIFMKIRLLRRAKQETSDFLEMFWDSREMKKLYAASEGLRFSPIASLFRAGYSEFNRIRKLQSALDGEEKKDAGGVGELWSQQAAMGNVERSLKRATIDQTDRLERAVSFLATTGNTTPFIGLFGTVWGIMESFRGIGLKGSANLAVVAPGISEALIATAAGLAAAIPAVVAFNYFTHSIAALRTEMDIFTSDFLSMVERQYYRKQVASRVGA